MIVNRCDAAGALSERHPRCLRFLLVSAFIFIGINASGVARSEEPTAKPGDTDTGAPAGSGSPTDAETGHDPMGPSLTGMRGLYRTWSAETYEAGTVVLGTSIEFFSLSDFLGPGDSNSHARVNIALAGTPIQGLELSAGVALVLNENTLFNPTTSFSLGDPFIGIRYGRTLTDWFALGGGIQLIVPSGAGVGGLSFDGTSFRVALNTDFRPIHDFLVSLHIGFHFDQSSKIFDYRLNEAQFFSAGINPNHQVEVGLGLSYQIADIVAPYVEYFAEIGLGAGVGFGQQPQRVGLGARFWPLAERTLNLHLGAEIGVGGSDPGPLKPRVPLYNIVFGVAWDFGQVRGGTGTDSVREVVKVERVEVPVGSSTGRIDGQVVDGLTGKPVKDARIVIGDDAYIAMSDRKQGNFKTPELRPGPTKLQVSADGYLPNLLVVLVKKGEAVKFVAKLQPATGRTVGTLKGTVRSVKGKPLAAKITIPTRKVSAEADVAGNFSVTIETGLVDVLITHKGFLTQRHKLRMRPGEEVILNIELFPRN